MWKNRTTHHYLFDLKKTVLKNETTQNVWNDFFYKTLSSPATEWLCSDWMPDASQGWLEIFKWKWDPKLKHSSRDIGGNCHDEIHWTVGVKDESEAACQNWKRFFGTQKQRLAVLSWNGIGLGRWEGMFTMTSEHISTIGTWKVGVFPPR